MNTAQSLCQEQAATRTGPPSHCTYPGCRERAGQIAWYRATRLAGELHRTAVCSRHLLYLGHSSHIVAVAEVRG